MQTKCCPSNKMAVFGKSRMQTNSLKITVLLKILVYKLYLNGINFKLFGMKTRCITSLWLVFLMMFFSCKKELEPQESSGVNNLSLADSTSNSPAATSGVTNSSTQNPSLLQQNSNQNTVGMNPPHGQAGHRCDIAVGAPLNSPPTKPIPNPAVTASGMNASAPVITKSNTTAVVTKPGMNPPHGQAGHRCDIAVGAPLDSPARSAVPANTNSSTNSQVPAILKIDSTAAGPK